MDHAVVIHSSVVHDGMELMDELVVVDHLVHIGLAEVDMTF